MLASNSSLGTSKQRRFAKFASAALVGIVLDPVVVAALLPVVPPVVPVGGLGEIPPVGAVDAGAVFLLMADQGF